MTSSVMRSSRSRAGIQLGMQRARGVVEGLCGGSEGRVIRDVAALEARARREGNRLATLTLDVDLRFASAASRAAFAGELADAIARLAAKYHDERAPGGRRFRLLAAVHPTPSAASASS